LNASKFKYNGSFYTNEFKEILIKITECYYKLRNDKKKIPLNDENGIRDILLDDYLKNPKVKKETKLTEYLFDKETSEMRSIGRVDIRVMPINPFISDEAYYILECKRLDNHARRGNSGLNHKYIENGILRFTSGFYSSYYKTNAMIGFIVASIDIHKNMMDINYLLVNNFKQIRTISPITKEYFIKRLNYHYSSSHKADDGSFIKLYHLMFDFSD
jgi:hypothetical protein